MMSNRLNKSFSLSGLNFKNGVTEAGAARRLKNMAVRKGNLRNVCKYDEHTKINNNNGFKIVHAHKAIDATHYIALYGGKMHHVNIINGVVTSLQELHTNINGKVPEVSHFGNSLCFRYKDNEPVIEINYLYYSGRYERFNIGDMLPLNNVRIKAEHANETKAAYYGTMIAEVTVEDFVANIEKDRVVSYDVATHNLQKRGYITGAAYIFFAVKLFDGSIVKPSKIYMLPVEREEQSAYQLLSAFRSDKGYKFYTEVCGCKVSCNITLPDEYLNNPLVKSVVIFSTRDYPIYDFSKLVLDDFLKNAETSGNPVKYSILRNIIFSEEAKNSIETPFYELKEIDINDFNDGYKVVSIDASDYGNIEFNIQYEPDFSVHKITSEGDFEYNNRLHKFGIMTELSNGYCQFIDHVEFFTAENGYDSFTDTSKMLKFVVFLDCGQQQKTVVYTAPYIYYRQRYSSGSGHSTLQHFMWDNLFSYPDSRASRLEIYEVSGGTGKQILSRTLKRAHSINYSYYIDFNRNSLMYTARCETGEVSAKPLPVVDRLLIERNKMNVSLSGNPYDFAPENSYIIGDNSVCRICDIAVSGVEINSDSFGMHPLTIFTTDGIYLVEQGDGDILYRRIVKITNDIILKGAKAHSVDGALFFASSRGLMSVVGRDTVCVSAILDGDNTPENISFNEYIKNAEIIYLNYYSEILVYNSGYDYAYVLSIGSGYWYMRDFKGERIGACDILTNEGVADVSLEEGVTPLKPDVSLAPFSFGDYTLSRIDTLNLEIDTLGIVSYGFKLWGSNDLKNWILLGSVANFTGMRRVPVSCRYFRIDLDVSKMTPITKTTKIYNPVFNLNKIKMEIYSKFPKHMMSHNDSNSY